MKVGIEQGYHLYKYNCLCSQQCNKFGVFENEGNTPSHPLVRNLVFPAEIAKTCLWTNTKVLRKLSPKPFHWDQHFANISTGFAGCDTAIATHRSLGFSKIPPKSNQLKLQVPRVKGDFAPT